MSITIAEWEVAPCPRCGDPKAPHFKGKCQMCPRDPDLEKQGQTSLLESVR